MDCTDDSQLKWSLSSDGTANQTKSNPSTQNNNGVTALYIASQSGHYQVVELLLKQEANPIIQNNIGKIAIYVASKNGLLK